MLVNLIHNTYLKNLKYQALVDSEIICAFLKNKNEIISTQIQIFWTNTQNLSVLKSYQV